MTKRKSIKWAIIFAAGFIIVLIILGVRFSQAASGKIIVYDNAGNVEHVEKFTYEPMPDYVPPPRVAQEDDVEEPEPPKGLHFIKEEPEEDVPEIDVDDEDEYEKDEHGKDKKAKRRGRDALGRKKRIKKIESERIGNKQVTVITREETDTSGRVFKTKEYTIDPRFIGNRRQQYNASKNAPSSKRFKTEKQIPTYKRRGYP